MSVFWTIGKYHVQQGNNDKNAEHCSTRSINKCVGINNDTYLILWRTIMKYPVRTNIYGITTFLVEADSQENAIQKMKSVSHIDYGADYCYDNSGEIIHIDDNDFSELNISVVEW